MAFEFRNILRMFVKGQRCFTYFQQHSLHEVPVYGVILFRIFPYTVRMRKNTGKNNSEYGHFLRSDFFRHSFRCKETYILMNQLQQNHPFSAGISRRLW